jgi:hypothetical protein
MKMKSNKRILIVLMIVHLSFFASGQTTQFEVGIVGGPSLSMLRYDLFYFPSKYVEAGLGGSAGFSLKYNFTEKLGIQSDLLWEMKGNTRTTDEDYRLNYITVPVLLQLKIGESPFGFVNFGPYIGFLLPVTDDISRYYKPVDIGVSFGAGLEVKLGSKLNLSFELRNNLGLFNVSSNYAYIDKHGNPVVEIGDLFTQTLVFQTGLVYNISKK